MPPKGKARAKSGSVGPKARAKASLSPEPRGKAKAKAKASPEPKEAKDPAVERAETLLRECLEEQDIARVDGRVLEIAVLDGRTKSGVDAALLAEGEARFAEWQAFQVELREKAEELRAQKAAAIARHEEENEAFGDAVDARKALKQRIEELFSAVEDSELGAVRAWTQEHLPAASEEALFRRAPLPVDCEDHELNTPLSEAACYGELEIVDYLLSQGAHVNARNTHGKTPLWRATYNGHEGIVKLLLDRGADPAIESNSGEEAGRFGTPATKALIAEWSPERTAERQAAMSAGQRLAKPWPRLLLEVVSSGDVEAATEVARAVLQSRPEEVDAATMLRTIVDCENMADALWTACCFGHAEVARVLLDLEADVDSCSVTGKTCLMMACRKDHAAVVRLLLERGARTYLRSAEGRLAADYAREAGHGVHGVVVEHCRRTREWSTLEDEARRSTGPRICGAEAVEGVLDGRRNASASDRATAQLTAMTADELREAGGRKEQLLEERALADVLGLG